MKPWHECTALVTGGRGNLGRAIASRLQAHGVQVVTTSRTGSDDNDLAWDMQHPESTSALLETLKARQITVDMLVHCAHVFSPGKLAFQVSADEFQTRLVQNLVPLYELTRQLARSMHRQKHGRVLLMGSLIAINGGAGKISYIVEKNAFNGLAKGFAAELANSDVTFAVLHPSLVDTDNIRERVDERVLAHVAANSDTGQLLNVDQVAEAALTLLDPTLPGRGAIIETLSGGANW